MYLYKMEPSVYALFGLEFLQKCLNWNAEPGQCRWEIRWKELRQLWEVEKVTNYKLEIGERVELNARTEAVVCTRKIDNRA